MYVREIKAEFRPEAAISALSLFATENVTLLLCNAVQEKEDRKFHPAGVGVYEFHSVAMSAFGWPNDEAKARHPVFKGASYGLWEVVNSTWDAWLVEQNRYTFPNSKRSSTLHHYFVEGHDSSFNCLAERVSTHLRENWKEAVWYASTRILQE